MKTPSIVVISLLIWGAVGFGLHRLISERKSLSPTKETHQGSTIETDTEYARDDTPRPTFDDVCQAEAHQAATLLSHYLRDATMEEVIALMEVAVQENRSALNGLMWLIQVRGIELDTAGMLAWTKAQPKTLNLLKSLFQHWAVLDPHAALEASLKESHSMRWAVIQSLKKADPDRAYAAVKALIPNATELSEFERLKWEPLVKRDVRAALEEASAIEDPEERERSLKAVVAAWADLDPLATLAWLDEQEDEINGSNEIRSIAIEKLADTQPSLAYTKIDAIPHSRVRSLLEGKVAAKWVEQDRDAALDWIKSQPQGAARDHLLAAMTGPLELYGEELLDLAIELKVNRNRTENVAELRIQTNEDGGTTMMVQDGLGLPWQLRNAVGSIAHESPTKAFKLLREMGDLPWHEKDVLETISKVWLEKDALEAANWAADLPETSFSKDVQESIFQTWGEMSAEDAADFIASHEISVSLNVARTIAKEWAQTDIEETLNWVNQLSPDIQERAFSVAIESITLKDPIQALQYIDRFADEGAQNKALQLATETWRKSDAPGVMSWLQGQPAEARVDDLLVQTSKAWVLEQPAEASSWIETLKSGPRRDQAVAGLVDALISSENPNKDFDAAFIWARTINNPELQQKWIIELESRMNP